VKLDISDSLLSFDHETLRRHIIDNTDLVSRFRSVVDLHLNDDAVVKLDEFKDFAADWIFNEAECVESFDKDIEMYGEQMSFSHNVLDYQGIYFYQSMDYDDVGYWLDYEVAFNYAREAASP